VSFDWAVEARTTAITAAIVSAQEASESAAGLRASSAARPGEEGSGQPEGWKASKAERLACSPLGWELAGTTAFAVGCSSSEEEQATARQHSSRAFGLGRDLAAFQGSRSLQEGSGAAAA